MPDGQAVEFPQVQHHDLMPKRLEPEAAAAVMRAAGVEPIEPYRNSQSPWRCRCLSCGREVAPRYTDVVRGYGGCKWCA